MGELEEEFAIFELPSAATVGRDWMPTEQTMFYCQEHNFVVNANQNGDVSSRGTPGHRVTGCEECTKAVNDAFAFAGWDAL